MTLHEIVEVVNQKSDLLVEKRPMRRILAELFKMTAKMERKPYTNTVGIYYIFNMAVINNFKNTY